MDSTSGRYVDVATTCEEGKRGTRLDPEEDPMPIIRAIALCLTLTACQAPLWLESAASQEATGGLMVVTCALPFDRCSVAPEGAP